MNARYRPKRRSPVIPRASAPSLRATVAQAAAPVANGLSQAGEVPVGDMPNLQMLSLFMLVAAEGSISGAARRMDLSASMANRKLAALERVLNVRLFERTTRAVQLTSAGKLALDWAQDALRRYGRVREDLDTLMHRPSGVIRLAVHHYAGTHYLPELLNAFLIQYPDIRIALTTTEDIGEMLEANHDLALVLGRIPDSRVIAVQLRPYRRVLCASRAYLDRHGDPRHPTDLARHALLAHSTQEAGHWYFRKGAKTFEQPVRARVEADNHLMLKEMAIAGLGIARLGEHILETELASGRLIEVLGDYVCTYPGGETPGLWLVYPQRAAPLRTRVLIEFLQRSLSTKGRPMRANMVPSDASAALVV